MAPGQAVGWGVDQRPPDGEHAEPVKPLPRPSRGLPWPREQV